MGDLREQLARDYPQVEHQLAFYAQGSRHPPYNNKPVADTLSQFCAEFLPRCPLTDPRRKQISVIKTNFVKLIGLKHKSLNKDDFPASEIIKCIEEGTFELTEYTIEDCSRMNTLFWLPELVSDPDAIYRNGHKLIAGDEVYMRVYDKMGSRVKLLFTKDIKKGGAILKTVPITSFLTSSEEVINFVTGQPLYRRT